MLQLVQCGGAHAAELHQVGACVMHPPCLRAQIEQGTGGADDALGRGTKFGIDVGQQQGQIEAVCSGGTFARLRQPVPARFVVGTSVRPERKVDRRQRRARIGGVDGFEQCRGARPLSMRFIPQRFAQQLRGVGQHCVQIVLTQAVAIVQHRRRIAGRAQQPAQSEQRQQERRHHQRRTPPESGP
ncbi:MAG: hypothetical protein R3F10_04610 [Lysobacteraceae bacterium]